ncbi:MAG TPA: FliM/FliN family flagellar motor C-terminal domain-containing protein [Sedimentisphaerales bacterium]|nr:FliM/FliN family flagellar motor C-terminal domain-containing protein [Sedimentisphaerales bacterium]
MSTRAAHNLTKEMMQQLLMAIGSGPMEDTTQIKATEYSWHQPHYFDRSQLNKLEDFTKKVARTIAEKFTDFCNNEFDVAVVSITQHFAAELVDLALESKQNDYYLAFGNNQETSCGLICVPTQTASIWATQLLGDTESEGDSRVDLSLLEESLLLDITSAIVDAFSSPSKTYNFQPAENIVRRLLPLDLKGTEELCKFTFQVKKNDQEDSSEAYILILSNKLQHMVGKTVEAVAKFSPEEISKAILGRMQEMPVSVVAQVASAVLPFGEIVSLRPNDILLLDKRIDEPIELIVNGQRAFLARPAKSAGKHAVLITELACNT